MTRSKSEVKNALGVCSGSFCVCSNNEPCPYDDCDDRCYTELARDCLEYIMELEERVKALSMSVEDADKLCEIMAGYEDALGELVLASEPLEGASENELHDFRLDYAEAQIVNGALKSYRDTRRRRNAMTLQEIKDSDKAFLLPKDVCEVMGSNPQTVRVSAKMGVLGFPVTFCGNRVKIPRIPFLKYLGEM